jgi:FAD/FMN-containing dehydrogenase
VAGYPDIGSGVAAIMRLYQSGMVPSMLEFFDPGCVAATRANLPGSLDPATSFLVITEADGTRQAAEELAAGILDVLSPNAVEVRSARTRAERSDLLRWRSGVSFAVSAQRGGKMSEDIAVPIEALGQAIAYTIELGDRHGIPSCSWGHAGDGNLHATFMIDSTSPEDVKTAVRAADDLFEFVASVGGTVSGEHGLGWIKREQFERQYTGEAAHLQHEIKRAFDPRGLFNPGKKLPRVATPRA